MSGQGRSDPATRPAPRTQVAVIDHGAGNLRSVVEALRAAGARPVVVDRGTDPRLPEIPALVVPGVGASGPAMRRLRRHGLDAAIRDAVARGAWYLGICLGLQLLFDESAEDDTELLGLLPGRVELIPGAPRLPHIGWNQVEIRQAHPLVRHLADGAPAYFVHSYAGRPESADVIVAETVHGGRFPSVVGHGRLLGTQFHPERSGEAGLRLLADFVELVAQDGGSTQGTSSRDGSTAPAAA
jgi:imidazole glycerol-phosphate synthase subunit HisH